MEVRLENNGMVKEVKIGFSWTMFFFGWFVTLYRGDIKWTLILFLLNPVTLGILGIVLSFTYNKIYIKELIEKGWKPLTENDEKILLLHDILNVKKY